MREVELKSVVDDVMIRRQLLELAGGRLLYEGSLEDLRYDTPDKTLSERDEVLRLRVYGGTGSTHAFLDWKGKTTFEDGYKVREELSSQVGSAEIFRSILANLGYVVIAEIGRWIAQYEVGKATVRFERYPRMDDLVEVEGEPDEIEAAIKAIGIERSEFSSKRLPYFVRQYEKRTGKRAALTERELKGEYTYSPDSC
jgi:predicted adenylyl cyclase CyaB